MQRHEMNFLNFSLPYFWRQGLSLNVELADLGRLFGQNTEGLLSVSTLLGLHCACLFKILVLEIPKQLFMLAQKASYQLSHFPALQRLTVSFTFYVSMVFTRN